jgi:hypothetical protein
VCSSAAREKPADGQAAHTPVEFTTREANEAEIARVAAATAEGCLASDRTALVRWSMIAGS